VSEHGPTGRTYSAYGLGIWASEPIPRLAGAHAAACVDVSIRVGARPAQVGPRLWSTPWYTSPHTTEDGQASLVVWERDGGWLDMLYADGAEFLVSESGTEIWVNWKPPYTLEDVSSYLMGAVMGLVLRLRGAVCLHGSAVAVDGGALAIVGPAGGGKSTTAAAFASRGYPVVSDDVLRVDERGGEFLAHPGYPRLRLWPKSVHMLAETSRHVPNLPSDWGDRRYHLPLGFEQYTFQSGPLPLRGVYILTARSDGPAAPAVASLSGKAGLLELVGNSFANLLLDRRMRAHDFDLLARVARSVPLRVVRPHADLARLPDLLDLMLSDFQHTHCTASA
jgi:hypothetical protein